MQALSNRLAIAICLLLIVVATVKAAQKPNVVICYVDDLGFGDLGSYGFSVVETSNIDKLAEQGLKYTQYYAPAPLRSPSISIRGGTVTGLDILPTLADLIGFNLPNDRELDGQSIVNTFKGKSLKRVKPLIWTIDMPGQDDEINEWAIRDGDWKLILDRKEQPKFLFNLEKDRYEVFNMLEKNPKELSMLMALFADYKQSIENDAIKAQRE